jgi:hypothetical protein
MNENNYFFADEEYRGELIGKIKQALNIDIEIKKINCTLFKYCRYR